MDWGKFWDEKKVQTNIKFDKKMETVYDLSYFLVDFQAVINNLTEMACVKKEKQLASYMPLPEEYLVSESRPGFLERTHPEWQWEIEQRVRSRMLQSQGKAEEHKPRYLKTAERVKSTTGRAFNRKYRMNMQLMGFSEGSLIIDIAHSLLVSIFVEFLKEALVKKTGNESIMKIEIEEGVIYIDGSSVRNIPKNSNVRNAIRIDPVQNINVLDVKKCVHDIVESAKPDENVEESVKRFLAELHKNGIMDEAVLYDERGIKTAVNDIERFAGHFIDKKI